MGRPPMRIRSFTSCRWGDVVMPTRSPWASSMAPTIRHTLPFPLVPATWITG